MISERKLKNNNLKNLINDSISFLEKKKFKLALSCLDEIKKNYAFVLEYELIKLDLEICDLIEQNARPNQIEQLQEQAMKNNNYSGCVFAFHCESIKRRFNVN